MKRKQLLFSVILSILVALSLFASACQQAAPSAMPSATPAATASPTPTPVTPSPIPTPTPSLTPTPLPTPSPAPTPAPTPTPTPTPTPPGFYENQTFGFSFSYPPSWTLSSNVQRPLILLVQPAPQRLPVVEVFLFVIPDPSTAAKQEADYLAMVKQGLSQFKLLQEKEVTLTADTKGFELSYLWTQSNQTLATKALFVVRQTQAFLLRWTDTADNFVREVASIDQVLYSFRLEEPRPLGIPRQRALTLYDTGPNTLDPALSGDTTSHAYVIQVFSGLVSFDKNLQLVPDIAERWQISPDGRTYTFYLRRGAKFHDGREVKATDFKYSWERAASPQTKSQTASTYLDDIVGVMDVLQGKAREISGVKVIDDYTLEVTIDAPKAYFLAKLTYPTAFVVDRANVNSGEEWWRNPNGTGPFKVKEWRKDELLVLERNPLYYGQLPKLDFIVYNLYGGVPMRLYENGEIELTGVSASDIERVRDEANPLRNELKIYPELSVYYIGFNPTKPPFDDVHVRRAFSMAVDRNKVVKLVTKDMLVAAGGILPPGMPGYNPNLKPLAFDKDKAKAELAASRYGDVSKLPAITMTISGLGGDIPTEVTAILQEWKQNLGVEVKIRQLEPEKYFNVIKKEKNELLNSGWVADYPDPQNFLDILFYTGSEQNFGDYSNPEVDSLLRQARVESDVTKRLKLYQDVEQKLVDDAAILPLWFGRTYLLVKPYVKDFFFSPMGMPILNEVYIEPH